MYFNANLQPRLDNIKKSSGFLTYNEKIKIINDFEEDKKRGTDLNLCLDHGGGTVPGFELKKDQIIGKINNMIINKKGDLMINGEIYNNWNKFNEMRDDMSSKRKTYGVSVWIDLLNNPDHTGNDDLFNNKKLNHVAITTDPGLGEYGAYIHEWGYNKTKIDDIFRDTHYNINEPISFWDRFTPYPNSNISNENIDYKTNRNLKYVPDRLYNEWSKGIFL